MKALMLASGALLAMSAAAYAQPTQLSAAAMDRVAAGGPSESISFSFGIPCPEITIGNTVSDGAPEGKSTGPTFVIPCPSPLLVGHFK
jgi:hypothetical protein